MKRSRKKQRKKQRKRKRFLKRMKSQRKWKHGKSKEKRRMLPDLKSQRLKYVELVPFIMSERWMEHKLHVKKLRGDYISSLARAQCLNTSFALPFSPRVSFLLFSLPSSFASRAYQSPPLSLSPLMLS